MRARSPVVEDGKGGNMIHEILQFCATTENGGLAFFILAFFAIGGISFVGVAFCQALARIFRRRP
jgi:hypothetical protein